MYAYVCMPHVCMLVHTEARVLNLLMLKLQVVCKPPDMAYEHEQ